MKRFLRCDRSPARRIGRHRVCEGLDDRAVRRRRSYPPFESKGADGKVVGFDVDLGNEICRRMNAKCVWIENDFDGMIPALKARKFDGVLSSMSMTPARQEQIAFSAKLFNTPTRLVTKKGTGLMPTAESLKGKSVGVEQGTIQETYAKTYWASKGVNVVPYQNWRSTPT